MVLMSSAALLDMDHLLEIGHDVHEHHVEADGIEHIQAGDARYGPPFGAERLTHRRGGGASAPDAPRLPGVWRRI